MTSESYQKNPNKPKKGQKEEITHPLSHPLLQKKPYLHLLGSGPYLLSQTEVYEVSASWVRTVRLGKHIKWCWRDSIK